jgi:CRISPR type I-A-associated protein Csa5
MIKEEIIKSRAVSSLARTLRYFVMEGKYQYVDAIRTAKKDTSAFEDAITKMLREGRLRQKDGEQIHLPNEHEIKEVFQLAQHDFDGVKTTLAMFALSFPQVAKED